jgi:hypothetical protein
MSNVHTTILLKPHGLLASGLRSKVVVTFTAEKAGNIHATVSIESRDQLVNVGVLSFLFFQIAPHDLNSKGAGGWFCYCRASLRHGNKRG